MNNSLKTNAKSGLKVKVVMLPTEKASNIFKDNHGIEFFRNDLIFSKEPNQNNDKFKNQHIYFVSDRKIKGGDWYLSFNGTMDKYLPYQCTTEAEECNRSNTPKIEATTDASIFEHNTNREFNGFSGHIPLPKIPTSFIKAYIESSNKHKKIESANIELKESHGEDQSELEGECTVKTREDNTVIIHPVKSEWSREEVVKLLSDLSIYADMTCSEFNKWIKDNL